MITFSTSCRIQHIVDRQKTVDIPQLLVDTGSEYTWVPEKTLEALGVEREKKDLTFVMANGQHITRSVGYAIVHVEGHVTVDEVAFAEEGDLLLLGAPHAGRAEPDDRPHMQETRPRRPASSGACVE